MGNCICVKRAAPSMYEAACIAPMYDSHMNSMFAGYHPGIPTSPKQERSKKQGCLHRNKS